MRTVSATRYVAPLREGGSLPAIVEADDSGMYVLKFRGAGQGPKALIAELLAGELARTAHLPVPEIVFIDLEADLGRTEPDPEIQDLIKASDGLNIGLDYLPGAVMFDPIADKPDSALASRVVWLDAYVSNVDRTARNTNLLVWHSKLQLIDHGAALYFHHDWGNYRQRSGDPFPLIKDHVLLPFATELQTAHAHMRQCITPDAIRDTASLIPDVWLIQDTHFATADEYRGAYVDYLVERLERSDSFLQEALRARS
jgi:hypothetical protein